MDDVEAVTSPEGRLLLASLPPYSADQALHMAEGLRAGGIDPRLVSAVLTQARLRARAHAKFGDFADGMVFTDAGLQQATRLVVAAHHAQRFRSAGIGRVADITAGIGADALAMAALGLQVTAVEQDPVTAAVAAANLARFPGAQVVTGNGLDLDLSLIDGVFADPGRRTTGGTRIFDPSAYSPPLDQVLALRAERPLGVKVAPGIPHDAIPADAEAQWVSVDGDVVEAALWFGPLRGDGSTPALSASAAVDEPRGRALTALVIRGGHAHTLGPDTTPPLQTGPLQEYLYEPDGAVIRASLIEQAAASLVAPTLVSDRIAYVTASSEVASSPFLTGYRVLDHFDFGLKRLKAYLRERDVGSLTIKKRGTAVDPADLRRRLGLRGENTATILLTRLGERQSVVVAEPLRPTER
jgi:hypothetical protein